MLPPTTCATTVIFRQPQLLCTELTFFRNTFTFLLRPRLFSRALGCLGHREPACTPRRTCEPQPRSAARALRRRNQELWSITTAGRSDLPEPSRIMETPQLIFFFSLLVAL